MEALQYSWLMVALKENAQKYKGLMIKQARVCESKDEWKNMNEKNMEEISGCSSCYK